MPTELPKNFHGVDPLANLPTTQEERKDYRKLARKALRRSLWRIASSFALHYVISLAGMAVIAWAGFSTVPRAALSATALGLLARWFLPNKARTQADAQLRQPQDFEVIDLTPEQLSSFLKNMQEQADLSEYDTPAPKSSPYL